MPELAEVEHARRCWDVGLRHVVREVLVSEARVFRGTDVEAMRRSLRGKAFVASEARGKQLALRFGRARGDGWLGLHLGMAGRLRVEGAAYPPGRHDHLILRQRARSLVFTDPRHFGRVLWYRGPGDPPWWSELAPSLLSDDFTAASVDDFLGRHARMPVKAALLMQARFPGVGNWMADEILWRARLDPATPAGALDHRARTTLWRAVRRVARLAVDTIDDDWNYPASWLFAHRWEPGHACPRCGTALARASIGGRTTCWCPSCQPSA